MQLSYYIMVILWCVILWCIKSQCHIYIDILQCIVLLCVVLHMLLQGISLVFLISFSLIHSLLCGSHLLHWNKSNIRCSSLFSFRITTFEFGWVAFIRRRYALAWVLVKPSVSLQAITRGGKQISSVGSPIAPLWSTWDALCSASFDRLESVSLRCAFRLSWRWSICALPNSVAWLLFCCSSHWVSIAALSNDAVVGPEYLCVEFETGPVLLLQCANAQPASTSAPCC